MSKVICDYSDIVSIADAVRDKNGTTEKMTLSGIVANINAIENKGGVQDISGNFNITLVEEMYEPGANLYYITFDDSIQLKDIVNLTLYFEYTPNSASYDKEIFQYMFAKMKTSDNLIKLYDVTSQLYVFGNNFIIDENNNRIQFIGMVNNTVQEDLVKYTLNNTRYEAVSI